MLVQTRTIWKVELVRVVLGTLAVIVLLCLKLLPHCYVLAPLNTLVQDTLKEKRLWRKIHYGTYFNSLYLRMILFASPDIHHRVPKKAILCNQYIHLAPHESSLSFVPSRNQNKNFLDQSWFHFSFHRSRLGNGCRDYTAEIFSSCILTVYSHSYHSLISHTSYIQRYPHSSRHK